MTHPTPVNSESDAVEIAREECARRGIAWREPYSVKRGWRWWQVLTPANVRGGNSVIYVSRTTGEAKVRRYNR